MKLTVIINTFRSYGDCVSAGLGNSHYAWYHGLVHRPREGPPDSSAEALAYLLPLRKLKAHEIADPYSLVYVAHKQRSECRLLLPRPWFSGVLVQNSAFHATFGHRYWTRRARLECTFDEDLPIGDMRLEKRFLALRGGGDPYASFRAFGQRAPGAALHVELVFPRLFEDDASRSDADIHRASLIPEPGQAELPSHLASILVDVQLLVDFGGLNLGDCIVLERSLADWLLHGADHRFLPMIVQCDLLATS